MNVKDNKAGSNQAGHLHRNSEKLNGTSLKLGKLVAADKGIAERLRVHRSVFFFDRPQHFVDSRLTHNLTMANEKNSIACGHFGTYGRESPK